jgi:ABC-type molybdenum transport system ATPase subunit/photorepair protein PhrA
LDAHIGDSPFVLLIDELNELANPLDAEAGSFLRELFLDKKNRYLVFTTHVPMDLDPSAHHFMTGSNRNSIRGVKSVSLPVSTDLTTLRKMPGC